MTVKKLIEILSEFDADKNVCINGSTQFCNAYAYDVKSVKNDTLTPYFGSEDEDVVSIRLGEQIGAVG